MNMLVKELLQIYKHPLDALVVVGAGQDSGLPPLRNIQYKRLILVEADQELAQELTRWIRPENQEEVHALALIADDKSNVDLFICNNRDYSRVTQPKNITNPASNLLYDTCKTVPAQLFTSFINDLSLSNFGSNGLILDIPDISPQLLLSSSPELLHIFSWIIFTDESITGALSQIAQLEEASLYLKNIGFVYNGKVKGSISPPPYALFIRNNERVYQYLSEREIKLDIQLNELIYKINTLENNLISINKEYEYCKNIADKRLQTVKSLAKKLYITQKQLKEAEKNATKIEKNLVEENSIQQLTQAKLLKAEKQIDFIKNFVLKTYEK